MYILAANADSPALEVYFQVIRGKRRLILVRRDTPQRRANSGEQLFHAERFRNVVVGSGVECLNLVAVAAAYRQHENRNVVMTPQLPAPFEPPPSRHVHVEKN